MQQPNRATPEAVLRRLNEPARIFFVDVRRREAWASSEEIIGGAIRIPPDELNAHVSGLPLEEMLVVYCSCPHEASSVQVARELLARGFSKVTVLEGGFSGWKQAKGPCKAKPAEPERRPSEISGLRHDGAANNVTKSGSQRGPDTSPPQSGVMSQPGVTPREGIGADGQPMAPVASKRSAHRS